MHVPVYMPLDEIDPPAVEEDKDEVWVTRDESAHDSYPESSRMCTNVTKETVLAGAGWDTVFDESADSQYDIIGDVPNGSLEEVIALERFQMKLSVFRKVIVATIDIYKILPHLSFVEYPNEFRQIANRNHNAAVELLIERLIEINCFNHGNMFIVGLQRCGYQHLAMVLDVKDEFDNRYTKKYISIMADTIKPLIVPSKVTRYLWSTGVISEDEVQLINNAETLQGIEHAVDTLLDKIQHRHVYWYSHFVKALRYADLTEAVKLLDIHELYTEHAGCHRSGGQIPATASRNNLTDAQPPPTTIFGITGPYSEQSTTNLKVKAETVQTLYSEYAMDSAMYNEDNLYDDTALPPVKITPQMSYNKLTKIVYVPEGHKVPLGFEGETHDTANYTNASADSAFVCVHGRDKPITEIDDHSSIGFVKIDGMRNNSLFVAESQVSSGNRLNKPPLPIPIEGFIEPPPLPHRKRLKGKQPYPLPQASVRDSPVPHQNDLTATGSYRQANHTLTEKRKSHVDDVNYEDDEIHDDGLLSDNNIENTHTGNSNDLSNGDVEMATANQIQKHHTSLNALDITSIHTFDKEMLEKCIEQIKHEQTGDIEKTELLNKMAIELNNLSSCKVEKIGALRNVKRADKILKMQHAELERIVTQNDNSDTNDEYPCEGLYSARQLETERDDAANIMRTLLMAVILNNTQTIEMPTRSPIQLQRNSCRNQSLRRLPKTRRSSFKDSAVYSCSNIDTMYEAPGLD